MPTLMKPVFLLLSALTAAAQAQLGYNSHRGWGHMPGRDWHMPATAGNSTFEQLLDHNNPEAGTFSQWYMYDAQYWRGPGSPIVLFTPGEINATGYGDYLTTNRTTGVLAEQIGAATIVLEHRYWGMSSPVSDLTTANMTYLTLDQAIHDLTYFAQHVRLPFAEHVPSNAADVPWVYMGGSYSGALAAWTASVAPGTFWAYLASSAPVQAISDYWGYFLPVQEGMPQNCSKDVSRVIDYMDGVLADGTERQITDLKTMFGLQNVTHNDDFMAVLQNGPFLWQSNQFYTGYSGFFMWCDAVEGVFNTTDPTLPDADGVGLDKALAGYASWVKDIFLPGTCESYGYEVFNGTDNTYCFDTYDPTSPLFTDTTLGNMVDRQWVWMLCNEPFGYWQDGAPSDRPTIVSRLVDAQYWIRQCGLYFPPGPDGQTYGIAEGKTEADVNAYDGGWDIDHTTRLIYANGGFDPWREAGVSSDLRPAGPLESTAAVPINIVPGGFHTSDLVTMNGEVNPGCKAVIDKEVAQLAAWVAEWPQTRHGWQPWHG